MRLKLVIEYDGSRYHGWQRQKNHLSIQQILEETIEKITHEKVHVLGSGRTDSGVHAMAQVAHCTLTTKKISSTDLLKLHRSMNGLMPQDIVIKKVSKVRNQFHAQYDVQKKTYIYQIHNAIYPSALTKNMSWWIPQPLNVDRMKDAAKLLEGSHDFKAFQNTGTEVKSTERTIFKSSFKKKGPLLTYEISGNGFLRQMVRNIVGSLVAVGKNRITVDEFHGHLKSKDRSQGAPPAPPHGLFLQEVKY